MRVVFFGVARAEVRMKNSRAFGAVTLDELRQEEFQ
jgi:hypothetical protein